MKILVLAPHPDDESIGCGGAIANHVRAGDDVAVILLTSGELGLPNLPAAAARELRENEFAAAAAVLGFTNAGQLRLPDYELDAYIEPAAQAIAPLLTAHRPERIYLPHPLESHPDHAACHPIIARAMQLAAFTETWLLGYEVWTPMPLFDTVEDITAVNVQKQKAIACYTSQLSSFAYDRAIAGLNQYRGLLAAHCEQAEVFVTLSPEGTA